MKRKILIVLFSFGTVAGFGSGIFSMARCHGHHQARRAQFEQHVADVCVDAARRAQPAAAQVQVAYPSPMPYAAQAYGPPPGYGPPQGYGPQGYAPQGYGPPTVYVQTTPAQPAQAEPAGCEHDRGPGDHRHARPWR